MDFEDDEELVTQFLEWVATAMTDLDNEYTKLQAAESSDAADAAEAIYGIAHNLKGMGSSFNFHLVTDIGAQLCLYLKKRPTGSPVDVDLVAAHIKAIKVVLEHKITGDGGEKGQALVARLTVRVAEAIS